MKRNGRHLPIVCVINFFLLLLIVIPSFAWCQVTVFVPNTPDIEKKDAAGEVDILMTMMQPFKNQTFSMDMPQMFAELRFEEGLGNPERKDLLSDIEEIVYQGKKAWGANIALEKPGLYQFIMETRPWWDEHKQYYIQQLCKVILPVLGVDYGWNIPAGLGFEVVPLTRPFGINAPAIFSGKVQFLGKPLPNISVKMGRINIEKKPSITHWHEEMAGITNQTGEFVFLVNQSGWWFCEAQIPGDPIKGNDGEMKPVKFGSILWFYVDSPSNERKK